MNPETVIAALRRSEQAWCEQICEWEPLDCGVAYRAPAFPALADGNQLRDVWLGDGDPETAYQRVDAHYREYNLSCRIWTPAPAQPIEPLENLLYGHGWIRKNFTAMGLNEGASALSAADDTIRILPARAMPKAYRESLTAEGAESEAFIEAGFERLDDANYDVFLAVMDGKPAGRIGYLEVGDIARLADLHIAPNYENSDVDVALTAHFLRTARRLLPRVVVACVPAENRGALSFLSRCGFAEAGAVVRFERACK